MGNWQLASVILVAVLEDVLEAMGMKRPVLGAQTIAASIPPQISRTSDAILLETELSEILFSNKN